MKNIILNHITKIFLAVFLCAFFLDAYGQTSIDETTYEEKDERVEIAKINVGYGNVLSKDEIASSVGSAGLDRIGKVTAHDVGNTLFGQLQGLRVFQNTGTFMDNRIPGLNIRGQATTQDGSILVLIDGVERPLSTVIPEEIESVSVLRDAAAKARYGQRGANGVLILNTKRGSQGKVRFFISTEQGITQPLRLPEFLDAASYAKAENEARLNDGLTRRYSDAEIGYFQSGQYPYIYPNVNWLDEVLKNNGFFSRYNFSFTGGNNITQYYVTINYQNDKGLFKNADHNDDYSTQLRSEKLNLRTNLSIRITPTTLVQANMGGVITVNRQPATPGAEEETESIRFLNEDHARISRLSSRDIVWDAFSIPSAMFPVKNENGSWGGTNQFGNNPVAEITDRGFDRNHFRAFFNEIRISQDLKFLLDGLSADIFGAYYNQADYWENKTKTFSYTQFIPALDASGAFTGATQEQILGEKTDLTATRYSGNQQRTNFDVRGEVAYNQVFGEHTLKSWLLFQLEQIDMHYTNQVYRYRNNALNVHYSFAGKYILDGTLSYSGTNRIQDKNDRYGLFPAIAGAWIISKESFMENAANLNLLKLRASYGKTGNGLISITDLTSNKYGGGNGYNLGAQHGGMGGSSTRETEIGITRKQFETSIESNIGVDVRLFDKLDLTGELFSMKRSNIFVPASGQYSTVMGLVPLNVPEGEVKNRGYELEAVWRDKTGDFSYFVSGMFSQYKNEIINQNEEFRPYDYLKRTGKPIGQRFGMQTVGFYRDEAEIASRPEQGFGAVRPGDIIYRNTNNDDIVDDYDQTAIGFPDYPQIYYSFSLGAGWKGFELSVLFQGIAQKSSMLSQSHVFWPLLGSNNMSTWYTNYWSESNREGAELPRLSKESDNNYRTNDIWVRNSSFLKLRYAELSYTLPNRVLERYKVDQVKVYLRGNNLLCFDNIKYVDPENTGSTYPSLKSYNIGISLNF